MTVAERGALSIDEAARYMGISPAKLWELVGSGEIPSVKIGRRRLILTDRLRQVLAELETPTVAA